MTGQPNFDRIARPYRWLERLTLGRTLEHTRNYFLERLAGCRQALVLGDGDGRFTASFLAANLHVHVKAVDISAAMLALLRQRCVDHSNRFVTEHASALTYEPAGVPDLIVTHFFLDCLTQQEVDRLTERLAERLSPGGLWVVSEFQVPSGVMRVPAWLLVLALYLVFRILTGLRVTALPDHVGALRRAGLRRIEQRPLLLGILTTELWQKPS